MPFKYLDSTVIESKIGQADETGQIDKKMPD